MVQVIITRDAQRQIDALPRVIQARILTVVERLADWPNVSGAKPLRKELQGTFRIRTGDYRLLFAVDQKTGRLTIFRVADRRDVYE